MPSANNFTTTLLCRTICHMLNGCTCAASVRPTCARDHHLHLPALAPGSPWQCGLARRSCSTCCVRNDERTDDQSLTNIDQLAKFKRELHPCCGQQHNIAPFASHFMSERIPPPGPGLGPPGPLAPSAGLPLEISTLHLCAPAWNSLLSTSTANNSLSHLPTVSAGAAYQIRHNWHALTGSCLPSSLRTASLASRSSAKWTKATYIQALY